MKYLVMVTPVFMMIGLYFIVLGIWELRKGASRENYIIYMLLGLVLTILLPWAIKFFNTINTLPQ